MDANPERDEHTPERIWVERDHGQKRLGLYHTKDDTACMVRCVEYVRADIAATAMRDRCVAKVREIREVWHSVATENLSADDDNAFARVRQRECGIRATSADRIIAALQSLTLEQGEQEK